MMSLQSRITKIEDISSPAKAYPYRITVRFLDEEEGRERVAALGLPDHTVVFATYKDKAQ